jgi:hypothetical protein
MPSAVMETPETRVAAADRLLGKYLASGSIVTIVALLVAARGGNAQTPVTSVLPAAAAQSQASVAAETPEKVDADRPGFTEPTGTLGSGVVQIESGFTFERERDGSRLFSPAATLLRMGVGSRFDLRVATDGYQATAESGGNGLIRHGGLADIAVGGKLRVWGQTRLVPAFSVLFNVSLPSGHRDFTSGGYDPTVKVSLSKDLPGGFNLGGNMNFSAITLNERHQMERAFSVTAAHDLPHGFGGYIEFYSILPAAGERAVNVLNGGVTHALGRNMQWDVEAGCGISGRGPRYFVAGGLVVRYPRGYFTGWVKRGFDNMKILVKPD